MPAILEDVVALVQCTDAVANAKAAIMARIEKNGGRVAARLGKEVSHIVWERRHSRRPSDKAADEAELMELFRKLEKMDYPPVVVSPLWVEESIKAGRRLVERKFLVKKPIESLLGRTPGSSAGAAAKKRKRPATAVLPKPAEAYELDDLVFSSTQQMHNDLAGPADEAAGEVSSPRGGKQLRRRAAGGRAGAGKQQRGGRGGQAAAAAMPAVAEEAEEDQEEAAVATEQDGRAPAVGSNTQAMANILTIDLPDDEPGHTPGPAGEEGDELDTPLALRFAKSSAERATGWGSGGSSGRGSGSGVMREGGAGPAGAAADKRSRLALASGPREQEAEAAGEDAIEETDSDNEQAAMQVDPLAAAQHEQPADGDQPAVEDQQVPSQQLQEEADDGEQRAGQAAVAKGVAARFSVRQLVQHPERPVRVHKGTPLPGALPSPDGGDKSGKGPIPIPVVERVTSPWALAEQVPATQPTQSQATQQPEVAGDAGAAREAAAGRPSIGGLPPRSGRRGSLLAVSNVRRASGATPGAAVAAASGATPCSAGRPSPVNPTGQEGKLPTPWSTLRPWDGRAAAQGAAPPPPPVGGDKPEAVSAGSRDENQAGPPQQQVAARQGEQRDGKQQQDGKASTHASGGSGWGARRATRHAAAEAVGAADNDAPGPSHGCISLTSVDLAVVDLARSATRRLRGLRLCPEGREEGQITHLVIGGERRTLKLMLAVANGAWLLSPKWVTASLEAGRWLPESQFPAKVRFEESASRARALLESPDAAPLLAEHSIYVHLPDKARKLMGANAAAAKRVATVLGAKIVPPKSCSLCLVVGGGARPPGLPRGARCLREEWLFHAAERFEQPAMDEYEM